MRFLKQCTTGLGDYTVEREDLFAGKTLDQIVNDIARMRPSHPSQTGAADEPRADLSPFFARQTLTEKNVVYYSRCVRLRQRE